MGEYQTKESQVRIIWEHYTQKSSLPKSEWAIVESQRFESQKSSKYKEASFYH